MRLSPAVSRNLWIGAMVASSTVFTLMLACAAPYAALAVVAARHVRRADGLALMAIAWLAAQLTGFARLHYALTAETMGWGVVLGLGAVAAFLAADGIETRLGRVSSPLRLVIAYVAAYAAFKLVVALGMLAIGTGWTPFAPEVLLRQFVRYGVILAGLLLLQPLLGRIGVGARPRRVAFA